MSLLQESRHTLKLALPLIIGQVSQMLLGVADTVMIGQLGVTELAVLTFANSLFYVPFVFGLGMLTPVSIFTANAWGAKDPEAARESCRRGMYVAVLSGLLLFAGGYLLSVYLWIFDQPEAVTKLTGVYFQITMASLVPALMATVLKNHADAMHRPWSPFWIFFGGVLLNVFLNWVMIYGNLGVPKMGLTGAAWATFISRCLIVVAMFLWIYRQADFAEWLPRHWLRIPHIKRLYHFVAIGFPASLQMIAEVTAFSAAGIIMGKLGALEMAAHQIALMCAATAFMVPLGLSMALGVRVGLVAGAEEWSRLRTIVYSGWLLACAYAALSAVVFICFGQQLASLYVKKPEVISLAAVLMLAAGIFQLFDSLQVSTVAMLRALKDVKIPALMGFAAYWLVGIPVAIFLSLKTEVGAAGVWCGLAVGLFVACLLMIPRLLKQLKCSPV